MAELSTCRAATGEGGSAKLICFHFHKLSAWHFAMLVEGDGMILLVIERFLTRAVFSMIAVIGCSSPLRQSK